LGCVTSMAAHDLEILPILDDGNLDKHLKHIGLTRLTFQGCVRDVKVLNKPKHPRFDELFDLLKTNRDLSEENVNLFMKYIFGEAAVCSR
jgi:hypothetical protein